MHRGATPAPAWILLLDHLEWGVCTDTQTRLPVLSTAPHNLPPRRGFSNSAQVLSSFQTEGQTAPSGCSRAPSAISGPCAEFSDSGGTRAEAHGTTVIRRTRMGRRDETPRYPGAQLSGPPAAL